MQGYLYRHIRLDTNEVFYVGIGKFDNYKYKRANNKCARNDWWKKIINKSNYEIEIIYEDNIDIIKQKEMEFIKLYGRKDLGLGTLVNHTDGGDGTWGKILSQEHKDILKKINTGKIISEETKKKMSLSNLGKIWSEESKNKASKTHTGMKHSDESKLKISLSKIGKKRPAEAVEKMRLSKLGKKQTQEHIQKRMQSIKNKKNGINNTND